MNKKNKMIMMIVHFTSLPRELNSIYIVSFFLLFYFFKIHFYVFIDCLISFFGLTIIYLTFFSIFLFWLPLNCSPLLFPDTHKFTHRNSTQTATKILQLIAPTSSTCFCFSDVTILCIQCRLSSHNELILSRVLIRRVVSGFVSLVRSRFTK